MRSFFPVAAALAATMISGCAQREVAACSAHVAGDARETVDVFLMVNAKGEVVRRWATWSPPRVSAMARYAPHVFLSYSDTTTSGIGQLQSLWMDGVTARQDPMPALQLQALGMGPRVWRGEAAVFGPPSPDGALQSVRTLIHDPQLRTAEPTARRLVLSLLDAGGRTLNSAVFDLDHRETRDALFRTAWIRAETAARRPATCGPPSYEC